MLIEYLRKCVRHDFFLQKLLDLSPKHRIYRCLLILFVILVSSNLSAAEVRFPNVSFSQSSMEPLGNTPIFSHYLPLLSSDTEAELRSWLQASISNLVTSLFWSS